MQFLVDIFDWDQKGIWVNLKTFKFVGDLNQQWKIMKRSLSELTPIELT